MSSDDAPCENSYCKTFFFAIGAGYDTSALEHIVHDYDQTEIAVCLTIRTYKNITFQYVDKYIHALSSKSDFADRNVETFLPGRK